jgi:hypothetical protein
MLGTWDDESKRAGANWVFVVAYLARGVQAVLEPSLYKSSRLEEKKVVGEVHEHRNGQKTGLINFVSPAPVSSSCLLQRR